MRIANVYNNNILAGRLTEKDDRSYSFVYEADYYRDDTMPAISLTLPKKIGRAHV